MKSKNLTNPIRNDWIKNTELYGRYITYLKLESRRKDKLNHDLKRENIELKRINFEQTKEAPLDKTQRINLLLPKPGSDFEQRSPLKQAKAYSECYKLLVEYKCELDNLFGSMSKQARDNQDRMDEMAATYNNEIKILNNKLNSLIKKNDFEKLYKGASRRVEDLNIELEAQSKHLENEIVELEKKIKTLETENTDHRRKEVFSLDVIFLLKSK